MKKKYGYGLICDFEVKGNLVRYEVCIDCGYDEDETKDDKTSHVGIRTFYYDFDWIVVSPCSSLEKSGELRDDLMKGYMPCVIVVKGELAMKNNNHSYEYWHDYYLKILNNAEENDNDIEAFYYGDYLSLGETLETKCSAITFPYNVGDSDV